MSRVKWSVLSAAVAACCVCPVAKAATINFSDLSLPAQSFYAGQTDSPGWSSGGATFSNTFTDYGGGYTSWYGWAYANVVDPTTPGYGNQYAAYPGGASDANGNIVAGGTYAVAYGSSNDPSFTQPPPVIDLPAGAAPVSVRLTNTTYTALSMANGSGFSKQFFTGANPNDYLIVTLTGYAGLDATGATTGSVDFSLANYQPTDFIVNDWQSVDLTPLGDAQSIAFTFASDDVGDYGINTPTYVALDNLVVTPEPASLMLLAAGGVLMMRRRSRLR
jgi:hypothetical protein